MSALSPGMVAALDWARAATARPEVQQMWNTIQRAAESAPDPDGAVIAFCDRLIAETDKIRAERTAATA